MEFAENITLKLTGLPRYALGAKPIDVYFNGSKVGSVGKAEELSLTFPSAGNVEFVTQYMGKERRLSFDVPGGTEADLSFDFGPLGGLKAVDQNADSGVVGFVGYSMDL